MLLLHLEESFLFLDSLSRQINLGTITFEDAALKFSDDEDTKNNSGLIINAETNTSKLSPDKIDRLLFFQVDSMQLQKASSYYTCPLV